MSSVAVLTPESFAEHRSGLKDQEITGNIAAGNDFLLSFNALIPAFEMFSSLFIKLRAYVPVSSDLVCDLFSSPNLTYVRLWGADRLRP